MNTNKRIKPGSKENYIYNAPENYKRNDSVTVNVERKKKEKSKEKTQITDNSQDNEDYFETHKLIL